MTLVHNKHLLATDGEKKPTFIGSSHFTGPPELDQPDYHPKTYLYSQGRNADPPSSEKKKSSWKWTNE